MPNENNQRTNRGRRNVAITNEHYNIVTQYSQLTGVPVEELLDEALSEYIEYTIETRVEDLETRVEDRPEPNG